MFQIYKRVNLIAWIVSLSSGYISRNEKRIDQIDTNLRQNFGTLEEIQNQINIISEKLDLINQDFQSRISKIEKN